MKQIYLLCLWLLMAMAVHAQQKTISGIVRNKLDNSVVPGVTVRNKSSATITDSRGRFSIEAAPGDVVSFTFIGMLPVNMPITAQTRSLDIVMSESANDLNTVVVTGYKSERKKDLTGSIAVVNMAEVKNIPSASPALSLQGRVPGLYITSDGSPTGGTGRTILIRGSNTLGNSDPLYIIDGVPTKRYDVFANLNANSISSVQVLKDASASSIYGSRASNGVIIVTTKQGEMAIGPQKVSIQLNSSLTIQTSRPWQENVLNAEQRGRILWQAAVNDKTDPNSVGAIYSYDWNKDFTNPILNKVNITPFVGGFQKDGVTPVDPLERVGNTNWQNELYKTAVINSHDLTITAGNGKSGLLIDMGYYKNSGLIRYTNYERYNGRVNSFSTLFNGRVKVGENLMLSNSSQVLSTTDIGGATTPELAITLAPTLPVYRTDGSFAGPRGAGYSDRNNPVDMQFLNRWNTNKQLQIFGNVYAEIEPVKNLTLRTSFGGDYSNANNKTILPTFQEGFLGRSVNSLALQQTSDLSLTWSNTAVYQLNFGKSRLNLLAGTESVQNDVQVLGAFREGFAIQDENYFNLNAGTGASTNNGSATGFRLFSVFAKASYSFDDKYLASATVRRDGSSRFGINNKYGIFPAVTLGWRISAENFLKDIHFINDIKLRAGIGRVGNQDLGTIGNEARFGLLRPNYGTIGTGFPGSWLNMGTAYDLGGINSGSLPSGFVQVQAENLSLKWESTNELNLGTDFSFLNDNLYGSFDYFSRKTKDILINPPIASAVGEGRNKYINGATKSNKGWEAVLGYRSRTSGGFSYGLNVTAAHFADIITALPPEVRTAYPGNAANSIIGHSQYSFFGYKTEGIFQNQAEVTAHATQTGAGVGRIKFKDLNGDGKIDGNDQTWLGTSLPKLEYGLRLDFGYKNFDLSLFGSGVAGKKGFDPMKYPNSFATVNQNNGPGVLNAWTPKNTGATTPALSLTDNNNEGRPSDFLIVKGDYFKLRNVQLGYTIPKAIAQKLAMQSLRFFVVGQNLFVLKSKSYLSKDPERIGSIGTAGQGIGGLVSWPQPTSVTFGLNVSF